MFVEEIAARLALSYDVTIIICRNSPSLPKSEVYRGVKILRTGFGTKIDKLLYPLLAFYRSLLIPHDIVYGVLESYAGVALLFYKLFTGRPCILNLGSGTLDSWKRGWGMNALLRIPIHRMPDKIHAISAHLASRARSYGAKDIHIIPNGVDLKQYSIHGDRDKNKIIFIGRLEPVKGIRYLIDAMPAILETHPSAILHIIGCGSLFQPLNALVDERGISESVKFRGKIPHEEIPGELSTSAIFVGPSLQEGQGIVFLEAQAAGVPIVASKVGGIPEIIKDGETGLLVPPKNSNALSREIVKLLNDKELRNRLADNARKSVEQFDWKNTAHQIENLILDTIPD